MFYEVPYTVQCFVLMVGTVACNGSIGCKNGESVQTLIQAQIDQGVEGTRTKDIDRLRINRSGNAVFYRFFWPRNSFEMNSSKNSPQVLILNDLLDTSNHLE